MTRQAVAVVCVSTAVIAAGLVWRTARRCTYSFEYLAHRVGERRFIEPRLTGGFAWAPCVPAEEPNRSIRRGRCSNPPTPGSSTWSDLVATIRAFQNTADIGGAERLHRMGVADLVLPTNERSITRGVSKLQEAVRRAPSNARIRSDLAASLYVLAQERDEPEILIQALAAARQAINLDSSNPEARFNLALILERLFLRDRARNAWEDFVHLDATSGWAVEARERQATLDQTRSSTFWKHSLREVRDNVQKLKAREVRRIVSLAPQEAREYALEDLLGEWGELVECGNRKKAEEPLTAARAIGEALQRTTGEQSVAQAVAFIDHAAGRPDILDLALGHKAYRDAQRPFHDQLYSNAASHLKHIPLISPDARDPLASATLITQAGIDLSVSRYSQAMKKYNAALEISRRLGSKALAGLATWGIGLVRLRQGQLSESLGRFLDAVSLFETGRERENLGAVLQLAAENLRFLGQPFTAWKYRYRAIEILSQYRTSIRLHNALWEGGWAAVEQNDPGAGLDLLDECVGLGEDSHLPQRLGEALLWRSKVHLYMHNYSASLKDLLRAERVNQRNLDASSRRRLKADLDYVEGEMQHSLHHSKVSLDYLADAIDFYSSHELFLDLPQAYLARFRAAMDLGQINNAQKSLEAALELFERRCASLTDSSLRLSAAESAQSLYDEMLLLQAKQGDHQAVLRLVERARALAGSTASNVSLERSLALMLPTRAVLDYARAGDWLFVFLLYNGRIEGYSEKLPAGRLERDVLAFVSAIARQAPQSKVDHLGKNLYRLLIPRTVSSLPGSIDLTVVPDKILNELPFAALRNPATGRYLIEERSIRIAPSIIMLPKSIAIRKTMPTALLVAATAFDKKLFGNLSTLPEAMREVRSLEPLYPNADVLIGTQATKGQLLETLGDHEVFHLAGHAVFNAQHPELSYFVLAPSQSTSDAGILFLRDFQKSRLKRLRLVVLSACKTLGPSNTRIGGISGLARPFLDAGVDAVVGSLWDVSDRTSAEMLSSFHRNYIALRNAPASLRAAQVEMLKNSDPALRSPSSWSLFQVVTNY